VTDTTLTFAERAILANQFQILERLDSEHSADYAQSREIFENGYEALYETINPAIKTASVPVEAGKEVFGILDMFKAIENSLGSIGKNADELSVAFEGFDAESHHHFKLAYFLRRKQGKWAELSHYPDSSPRPALPRYRKMLEAWHSLGKPPNMTKEQLTALSHQR
jgi:uncharacterized protein